MVWSALGKGFSGVYNAPPNSAGRLDPALVGLMRQIGGGAPRPIGGDGGTAPGKCGRALEPLRGT